MFGPTILTHLSVAPVLASSRHRDDPLTHWLAAAGPVIFTIASSRAAQPDYSHAHSISALAAWPLGWVQELNVRPWGHGIAFSFGLHKPYVP